MMRRLSALMRRVWRWRWPWVGGAACAVFSGVCALAAPWQGEGGSLLPPIAIPGWRHAPNPAQVRIQQHMSIRITPGSTNAPPNMIVDIQQEERSPRYTEKRIGPCLPVAAVAGVQSTESGRLLLFMRDTRVISAVLEKSCRATDYYSGFYVERNADGQICVERDKLHARSGANCKIRELRALVETPPRRFP